MKKKLLTSFFAIMCVFSLAACSASADANLSKDDDATQTEAPADPTAEPTEAPTPEPTEEPTPEPTEEPTPEPTEEPTPEPTEAPAVTEEPVATEVPATAVDTPADLSDDIYSFQISVDGTVYQFPMWYSDFQALGWEFKGDTTTTLSSNQYTTSETWKKDGFAVYTMFANLSMNSVTFDKAMVAGITFDDYYFDECEWEILLPKGIQYGVSTKEDIIAAYGAPSDEYDGSLYYKLTYEYDTYEKIELYVFKDTGTLDKIDMRNIVELEGADNSVDPTVPDIVTNYVAPEAVGDDLYKFNIELEGNLYTLPCPVSTLLANGFTINEGNSEMEIAAGSFGWVEFRYNNQSYRTIVRNYADYATIAENCFVTSMESSIYDPDFQLTIPCDINRGDTEEDLLKVLENFNYELDDSSSAGFKYYKVYDPNESKLDAFTITTKDGEVVIIEVSTRNKPQ